MIFNKVKQLNLIYLAFYKDHCNTENYNSILYIFFILFINLVLVLFYISHKNGCIKINQRSSMNKVLLICLGKYKITAITN